MIKNYHILKVTYLGATNTTGSRVKIASERFKQSRVIPYNHEFNSTKDIAADWCAKNGFELIGAGEGKDCYYLISTTFEPLKK